MNINELKIEFANQGEDKKYSYQNVSYNIQLQAEILYHDIIYALENTHGNVSCKALANHIGGIATLNTIASHLKSLDGYSVEIKNITTVEQTFNEEMIRIL